MHLGDLHLGGLHPGSSLPPANEVWGKVIFLHVCVILSTGGVRGRRGMCMAAGGACVVARGGMRRTRRDTVNERVVRILLECILVLI